MSKQSMLDFTFKYGAIVVMIGVFSFFSITEEHFLTYNNITDILRSIAIVTFIAIGVTISQIVDGFDLSVGSTVSLSTVVSAALMVWYEQPLWIVVLVPILIGALVGVLNALLIVKIRIPDLLATLAVMYIIGGVQKTFTQGFSIYGQMLFPNGEKAPGVFNPLFLWIGQGKLWGIPFPVILLLITVTIVHIFLNYTRWGRQMYITGGNREAARLSGINVNKIRLAAYILSGCLAGIAGILFAARVGSGQIDAGAPLLMESVAAVFVGYSVLGAGKPNVLGTFFGAALIGILLNGLTMMNLPYYSYDIIKGSVLVFALSATFIHLNRKRK
jgi:simple sugar transport system permease protein